MCQHIGKVGIKNDKCVPVSIKYENNGKQITAYTMLDNFSQDSFVHVDVLKQLAVKGFKTTLSLKILHGGRLQVR